MRVRTGRFNEAEQAQFGPTIYMAIPQVGSSQCGHLLKPIRLRLQNRNSRFALPPP